MVTLKTCNTCKVVALANNLLQWLHNDPIQSSMRQITNMNVKLQAGTAYNKKPESHQVL